MRAPDPPNEHARLAALRESGLLDSAAEEEFDGLVRLAARICCAPIALVSLVDAERQWFKARVGLEATETPRELAFCAWSILDPEPLIVRDARDDDRFRDNPLVTGDPKIRFYAGTPLITLDGLAMGTLCVIDREPRVLNAEQLDALRTLGTQAANLLDSRRQIRQLERFRTVIDNSFDLVMRASLPDLQIELLNRAGLRMLELDPDDAARRSLLDCFAPDFVDELTDAILPAVHREGSWTGDVRLRGFASGRAVPAHGRVFATRGRASDEILGVAAILRDRTEIEADRAQIRQYEDLFDRVSTGLYVYQLEDLDDDRTLRLVAANAETEALTHVPPSEYLGMTIDEAFPEARAGGFVGWFTDVVRTGKVFEIDEVPHGGERVPHSWFRIRAFPLPERRVGVAFENITAQKQAQSALAESEKRYRMLASATSEGIAVLVRGRIVDVNDALCRMAGRSRPELLGSDPLSLVAEGQRDEVARRVAENSELTYESEIIHADGTIIPVQVAGRAIQRGGQPARVTVLRDLRERRRLDRMKSEFVSTVSHELRTPLTLIRGSLGLIDGGVAGALPEQAAGLVRIALTNSLRLGRLVDDILDLEKMSQGDLRLSVESLDGAALVTTAAEQLKGMAITADVTLTADLARAPKGSVLGDAGRLLQVLANLLSNAIKYSPAGAEVVCRVEDTGAGTARFAVIDRGPGIPAPELERIFDRFHQVDSSDARAKSGTGLGLAISRAIVHQHGGRIGADSVEGEGTEMWFTLPLEASLARSDPPYVLLVEDDPALSHALARYLRDEGWLVEQVTTVSIAREAIARSVPAAVLLDVGLPDGSGLALLADLASLGDVPVIVLSGSPARAPFEEAGPLRRWLTKPVALAEVVEWLRVAVSDERAPTVLVAEDDGDVRRVIGEHLERLGCRLLEAADGAQAVALARSERPDLVVLDVGIPGIDGFAVVEELRSSPSPPRRLVVYTGRELDAADRRRLTLGLTQHLLKARHSPAEVSEAARALLGGLLPSC